MGKSSELHRQQMEEEFSRLANILNPEFLQAYKESYDMLEINYTDATPCIMVDVTGQLTREDVKGLKYLALRKSDKHVQVHKIIETLFEYDKIYMYLEI